MDFDDGWEILSGPAQFESQMEMKLAEFCTAAQEGNLEKLQEMLDRKLIKDINLSSPQKKETVLHFACRSNSLEVVKFLVEKGCNVNLKDTRLKHSLHVASAFGHLNIVKYLNEHDADMTFVDKYGRSSLHWAITNKHFDVVVHLLNVGAPVLYTASCNWQPLHEAAKSGDLNVVKLLIQHGSKVNDARIGKSRPFTPLHVAAREGHTDCLKFLLDQKADVNAANEGKQTPLHEAAFKGRKDCCRELILKGADPHAKNDLGRTPLLDACNQGNLACAIHCLDAGCFVNQTDRTDNTPLHHLLKSQGKFFLDAHDDPLKLTMDKLAAFTDILLQYGANPNLANEDEETPFIIANSMQEKDVLDVIYSALDKPQTLLNLSKVTCRRIMRCDNNLAWNYPIPKNLQVYLLQNTAYFTGW